MKNSVIVATHHKTGTVWMATVFKAIAEDLNATYVDYWAEKSRVEEALKRTFVLFNYDSDFRGHSQLLSRDDVRILHVIRDPRDVLISAMHYHRRANESWLHEPVPGYDNITYQRRLNAFETRYEQYVFEMENSTDSTLRDMQGWQYDSIFLRCVYHIGSGQLRRHQSLRDATVCRRVPTAPGALWKPASQSLGISRDAWQRAGVVPGPLRADRVEHAAGHRR